MDTAEATNDVISISSSDNESDCRIVKVVSSPAKRGKSKMRWQYQPSSMPRARASRKERETMMTRQRKKAVYDDRQDRASTSRGYTRRLEADSISTCGDAVRNSRSQGTGLGVEPLRFGPLADVSTDMESNNTKTTSYAMVHVDLTGPLSMQHDTADLEPANASPPLLSQSIASKQALRDDVDERHRIRSRSCSTATLDCTLKTAAAQWGSFKGFEGDAQGIIEMIDEPPKSLPNSTTELIDPANYTSPSVNSPVSRSGDDSILSLESMLGESNRAVKTEKSQDADEGSLLRPIKAEPSSPILQNYKNTTLQPHKNPSVMFRRQLPRVGKWRAWNSIINFSAFDAMPGPLFTRQKKVLHSMTYDDLMRERAKKEAKRKGAGNGDGVAP